MTDIKVGFKRLSDSATLPTKAHKEDSGFDLYVSEDVTIEPGETIVVSTGIVVVLPEGHEAQVRPRSGVTSKTKLRVQIGTIDNPYTGEIGVIIDCIHPSDTDRRTDSVFPITKGDRIAQLVVQPIPKVRAYEITGDIEETERGNRGYGSSGV